MKQISLDQLLTAHPLEPYSEQVRYILSEIEADHIRPVVRSPKNGKKPALYTRYWIVSEKKDYSAQRETLLYRTNARISTDYYLAHLDVYADEEPDVMLLSRFLTEHSDRLLVPVSWNERSFEIWGREKFLSQGTGKTLLRHCGIDPECLNCYPTAEPFAYFTHSRQVPQNILILENKDPFYSMRAHLLDGRTTILGETFGTLIYGAGKRVNSSLADYARSAEPYMMDTANHLCYFGDLDYEGILIYETLARDFPVASLPIVPFVPAYLAMLQKAAGVHHLPETREGQNRHIGQHFLSFFEAADRTAILTILEQGRYIPQEILNRSDF